MLRRNKPDYLQKQKEAARAKERAEDAADRRSIIGALERVATNLEAREDREKVNDEFDDRVRWPLEQNLYRIQKYTIVITAVGMVAAIAAAIFAGGSYIETENAVAEAKSQTVQATRQADTALENLPRSWLYVDFPKDVRVEVNVSDGTSSPQGMRTFHCYIKFGFKNYGQLPATILSVRAKMYVPNTSEIASDTPFSADGQLKGTISVNSDSAMDGMFESEFSGKTIAAAESFTPSSSFIFPFFNQPDFLWSPEGMPKWIWILIKYKDPFGSNRETSYFGRIDGRSPGEIDDPRYTYQH